jgi:chromate transporter
MFSIGVNTFGGPVAQIGVMHREAVERRGWLSDGEFVHLLDFANVLPGPEALEIAIHLGYLRRGVAGGIAAGLLFVWPGFVSLTFIAWLYDRYGDLGVVKALLDGIRPVAMGLIGAAATRLALRALRGFAAYALMVAAFAASFFLGVPFISLLVACGVAGLVLARTSAPRPGPRATPFVLALVALALLAGFVRSRPGATAPGVEGAPAVARTERDSGWERQAEIAWVSTKAALVTFGGAYTMLPYLREETVVRKGWVTDGQIADALALGETTPGPLISFGIFLAYLAGGLPGAIAGGVFLFLPAFVLVLTLGRHAERVERLPGAGKFLWGVSSGTVGLILAMSAQVVPVSLDGRFEAAIALAAFVALWRFGVHPLAAVGAGAALGLARALA